MLTNEIKKVLGSSFVTRYDQHVKLPNGPDVPGLRNHRPATYKVVEVFGNEGTDFIGAMKQAKKDSKESMQVQYNEVDHIRDRMAEQRYAHNPSPYRRRQIKQIDDWLKELKDKMDCDFEIKVEALPDEIELQAGITEIMPVGTPVWVANINSGRGWKTGITKHTIDEIEVTHNGFLKYSLSGDKTISVIGDKDHRQLNTSVYGEDFFYDESEAKEHMRAWAQEEIKKLEVFVK